MKKTLLLMVSLLMGVNAAWATVTATISGMNQVGDYYYPIYTLSESSSISSFTSSNGSAPAVITDGTTLTFSHRGTVTLSGGEEITGKKYSSTVYDLTALKGTQKTGGSATDGIWGFSSSETKYNRYQWNSLGKGNTSTEIYNGITVKNTASTNTTLYLIYYYSNSNNRHGMQLINTTASFTITNGATIAKMDYYDNHLADKETYTDNKYPATDLTLSDYAQTEWVEGATPVFNLYPRDDFYLYRTITTYTEIAETLSDITVTLTGFAENSTYFYPVYTITATHDEDDSVSPTLTDGDNFDVSSNVLTYTTATSGTTEVNISYSGVNTTVEVPASIAYYKTTYDLGNISTYLNYISSASGSLSGFTPEGDRYTLLHGTKTKGSPTPTSGEIISNMSFAASEYGWVMLPDYGLQVNGNDSQTYNITISNATGGYAILYHNIGDNPAIAWDSNNIEAEDLVAASDGTITLACKDKNSTYYAYTQIDLYKPLTLTSATATLAGFAQTGIYHYPVYTIKATASDGNIINPTITDGDNYSVSDNVLTYTATTATTNVTITYCGASTTVDVPASIKMLKRSYDLSHKSTFTTDGTTGSGEMTGFDYSGDRYNIGNSGELITGMTFGDSQHGWLVIEGYALQNNHNKASSNISISNVAGGYAILYHKQGATNENTAVWAEVSEEAEEMVASSDGTITLTCLNKNYASNGNKPSYAYTKIELYVPASLFIHTQYNLGSTTSYPSTISDKDAKGTINGFTDATSITRYNLSGSTDKSVLTTLFNLTLSARWGWLLCQNYGAYFSAADGSDGSGIFKVASPITSQLGILSFKIGDIDNPTTWEAGTNYTQSVNANRSALAFNVYDKDGRHEDNKAWIYTQLDLFTPIANAKQDVTVSEVVGGMSTLRANHPMDFSGDDIKAYKATWNSSTNMVRFTRVNKVPANTPVLVKYKTATTATETVNFCNAEDADVVGDNILVAGTGAAVATTDGDYTNFILTTKGEDYGFYYANDKTVSATKAYLHIPTASLPAGARLTFVFDDEENGVTAIGSHADRNFVNKNGFYNLQGQRISAPRRGLYIRDGKKMLMK